MEALSASSFHVVARHIPRLVPLLNWPLSIHVCDHLITDGHKDARMAWLIVTIMDSIESSYLTQPSL